MSAASPTLFIIILLSIVVASENHAAFTFNSRITKEEEDAQAQFAKAASYPRQEVAQYPVMERTGMEEKLKILDLSISKFQTSVEYITQQLGRRLESIEQKLARLEAATDVQRIAKQQDQSNQLNTKLDVINEKLSTRLSTIDGKIDAKLERSWTKLDMLSHGYDKQFEDLMGRVVKGEAKRETEYQRHMQKLEVVENLLRTMGKMIVDSMDENGRKMRLQGTAESERDDYAIIQGIYSRLDRIINETVINKPKCEAENSTVEMEEKLKLHTQKLIGAVATLKSELLNSTALTVQGDKCSERSDGNTSEELIKLRTELETSLSTTEQQNRDLGEALSVIGRTFEAKLQNLYQNVAQAFKVLQESQIKLTESCSLQADRRHQDSDTSGSAMQQSQILEALRNTSADISHSFERSFHQLRSYVDGVMSTSSNPISTMGSHHGRHIDTDDAMPPSEDVHNVPQTEDPKADFPHKPIMRFQ